MPGEVPALQPGVILHAQTGQQCHLGAPQTRHTPVAASGQTDLLGKHPRSACGEEITRVTLVAVGHAPHDTSRQAAMGCPDRTPLTSDFREPDSRGWLKTIQEARTERTHTMAERIALRNRDGRLRAIAYQAFAE